jgi:hypothetical protein
MQRFHELASFEEAETEVNEKVIDPKFVIVHGPLGFK